MKKPRAHKNLVFINLRPEIFTSEYAPKPATHFLPDWYKKMETHFPIDKPKNSKTVKSIKKCIPVFDAITAGYVITTACDISVEIIDGEPTFHASLRELEIVTKHIRKQAYAHPLANEFNFPKFTNYWGVSTPSGYSCLFVPPLHNPNPYFTALPGIVDTDTYQGNVNFPFILTNPHKDIIIPAGTPIVQIIPFKRDKWQSSYKEHLGLGPNWFYRITYNFFNSYKNKYWVRKEYK